MIDSGRGDNGDYDWAIKLGRGHSVSRDIGLCWVLIVCSKRGWWAVRPVGWVGVVELGQLNVS